jgi:hypothetical protein
VVDGGRADDSGVEADRLILELVATRYM